VIEELNLNGPLEGGTLVLEASAGTGKTYALSHRVLREVAENGLPLESILVVTFTRAAAAEIRRRIRERLNLAATALAYALADCAESSPELDPTLAALISGWRASQQASMFLLRLLQALDRIDLAPITTIHGFIQTLIRENAQQLGLDPQASLQENSSELLEQVVTDWRRSRLSPAPAHWQAWVQSHPDLRAEKLLKLAQLLDDDRDMQLSDGSGDPAVWRHWQNLEQRFLSLLEQQGESTSQALLLLCKGSGNKTPAEDLLTKTKLGELAILTHSAQLRFSASPSPSNATSYRRLSRAFSSSQLRKVLADPSQAPVSGLHGAAERFCFEPLEALMQEFANHIRQELRRRREGLNQLSFGDLLAGVDPALLPTAALESLQLWCQRRLRCCLIDEFQDTDPIQWRLFAALFDGVLPLILIGDPKQAIYRFRGGDIRTYRLATSGANRQRALLNTNRRSDPDLLNLFNGLFSPGEAFGTASISYQAVKAPEQHAPSRLRHRDGSAAPALRLRWITADAQKPLPPSQLRRQLAESIAIDLQQTLGSGLQIASKAGWRDLGVGDLAVLVGRNSEALALQSELLSRGIPARIGRGGNLWHSPEAASLSQALGCLEAEGHRPAAAALALSSIGGHNAAELQCWDGGRWGQWLELLQQARRRYSQLGPLAALEVLLQASALPRLAALTGGSQRVSDLLQLAELLQQAWQDQGCPSAARLNHWLEQRRLLDHSTEETQQRLVASGAMVTISTLHASKGLEFPLVWCPTLWATDSGPDAEEPFRCWDQTSQRRLLELSRRDATSPRAERLQEARLEAWQERLRLGYVGLTRARHQLTLDWGRIKDSASSLPAWLLHPELRLASDGPKPWQAIAEAIKKDLDLQQKVQRRCQELGIAFDVPQAGQPPYPAAAEAAEAPAERGPQGLAAPRRLSRWGRWSFSRLLDSSRNARDSGREEEGFDPDRDNAEAEAGELESEHWKELPAGAAFGTLVHEVLELIDYDADPLQPNGRKLLRDAVARSSFNPGLAEQLQPALAELLQQPLGGPLGNFRLCQLARCHTLREWPFDRPLSGYANGPLQDVLGQALQRLSSHPNSEVRAYACASLASRAPQLSAGFLNGVVDLVFRSPPELGPTRWVVLDWKTNRLPHSLASLMAAKHYWLQAQLYREAVQCWLQRRLGSAAPPPVDAVMFFTRCGKGAWLEDPSRTA
jgi:exodeoxyribonuclease V beta subunit